MITLSKSVNKYLAIFSITWAQATAYRLNFVLWRVRSVLQLLLTYFIWWTVFESQTQIFGYTQQTILSYILISALIRAIILSSRVIDVAGQIHEGNIVNFLIKPISFIKYYFVRDLSDKLLNVSFVVVEILLLLLLLQPPLLIQTDLNILILTLAASILGLILYFALSFSLGLLAFWVENAWGPYFLLFIFLEGLGGGLFPIDILPKPISNILLLTPFPYLIYFPSKLYLGTMSFDEISKGFLILIFWVVLMWFLMLKILKMGLKHFTAVGH